MSDLLDAAAAALGTPSDLVQRSAAARAAESGATVDDILAAWAGGAPVATAPAPDPTPAAAPVEEAPAPEPASPVAVMEAPVIEVPEVEELVAEPEPEEPLEPVSLGDRLKTAVRIGAWTGAALGLVAFLAASAFWAPTAAVLPDVGPIVQVSQNGVVIGVALASILFGAIVAGFSRAAAAWSNPAMQLSNSKSSTAWIGAILGLILGVVAGVLLTSGFGTVIEASEGLIQLQVLPTIAVMLFGGGILGAVTATLPQLMGTPVAIDESDAVEVEAVRGRLRNAIGIPMAAVLLLVLLVIPFGYTLIQSNHLGAGGASIVGILTASGILGFAALAGSKPEIRISFGELMVAVVGVGTVLVIILAVLFYTGQDEEAEPAGDEQAAVVLII